MTNSENAQGSSNERCINWPCQLPRAHTGPCSTEGKQSQRVSDVRLRQLLRMGACLSNEAVDDMRLAVGELLERRSSETGEQEIVGYVPYNWTCNEWDKGTFEGYGEVLFDLSNGWEWRPVYGEKAPAPKAVDQRLASDAIRDLACCDHFVRSSASEFCDECGYTNLDHLRKRSSSSE